MELIMETNANLATLEKKVDVGFARVDERFKRVDERLDDLNRRMDERSDDANRRFEETLAAMKEGFKQAEDRSIRLQAEMKAGFERVDEKFERVDQKFERVDEKFERGYALVVKIGAGLIGTLIAAICTVIVTHL